MGNKTVMVLVIPEPKVRKATAKAERPHRDKTKYTRKVKHKAPEWGLSHARRSPKSVQKQRIIKLLDCRFRFAPTSLTSPSRYNACHT